MDEDNQWQCLYIETEQITDGQNNRNCNQFIDLMIYQISSQNSGSGTFESSISRFIEDADSGEFPSCISGKFSFKLSIFWTLYFLQIINCASFLHSLFNHFSNSSSSNFFGALFFESRLYQTPLILLMVNQCLRLNTNIFFC